MESGNWRGEGWPGPEAHARRRLPQVEDLAPAEQGYDPEQVREAFDSFYRHIAQLDSTVRALEMVEVFRDQAGELRKELRALKAAGWAQQPWRAYAPPRVSAGFPESLPRFAIEAAFLVIVAVVVAVAGFDRLSIVLVMGLAWAIVGVVEWAASRERFARRPVSAPVRARGEPAPAPPLRIVTTGPGRTEAVAAWEAAALPAPQADDEDELTVIREADEPSAEAPASEDAAASRSEPEPEPEPEPELEAEPEAESEHPSQGEPEAVSGGAEPDAPAGEPEAEPVEPAAESEAEQAGRWSWAADVAVEQARADGDRGGEASPRRRFWQRRRNESDGYRFDPTQPRHVRVLPPAPSFDDQFPLEPAERLDPWEQGLDLTIEEPEGTVDVEREPEPEHAFAERDRGESG